MHLFVDRLVEVKLRCLFQSFLWSLECTDLVVYVNGSALIPARVYGSELDSPIIVCHLVSAKELVPSSALVFNTRIYALRIGMPDVYSCSFKKST